MPHDSQVRERDCGVCQRQDGAGVADLSCHQNAERNPKGLGKHALGLSLHNGNREMRFWATYRGRLRTFFVHQSAPFIARTQRIAAENSGVSNAQGFDSVLSSVDGHRPSSGSGCCTKSSRLPSESDSVRKYAVNRRPIGHAAGGGDAKAVPYTALPLRKERQTRVNVLELQLLQS